MLPEILGKEFYQRKVYPAPIKMHGFDNKGLEKQLNEAAACSYFMPGNGPNYSVRIGRTNQTDKDIARNAADALAQALGNLVCWDEELGFENVQQVTLKIGESIELPVYSHLSQRNVDAYIKDSK